MRLSKNAALEVSQISFTIKSAYTAGVLFVGSACHKIGFTPTRFHANFIILHSCTMVVMLVMTMLYQHTFLQFMHASK